MAVPRLVTKCSAYVVETSHLALTGNLELMPQDCFRQTRSWSGDRGHVHAFRRGNDRSSRMNAGSAFGTDDGRLRS